MLFNERAIRQGFVSGTSGAEASKERVRKMFEELALPLTREMADSIFTRDRILELVADLRKYRSERFAAGDWAIPGQVIQWAQSTISSGEDSPGQNSFLLSLCWVSLESAIKATAAESGHGADWVDLKSSKATPPR